jgi:spermidine synthase
MGDLQQPRRGAVSRSRATFNLLLASALGLFLELTFIRWLSSEVRVFGFYKNFALIAAFLGLGLGFATAKREQQGRWLARLFFPSLALAVAVILLLGRTPISDLVLANRPDSAEFIWSGSLQNATALVVIAQQAAFYAILWSTFLLLVVLFMPVGAVTAHAFRPFKPLPAYVINIVGSLLGILAYTLVSFLGWSPAVWFSLCGAAALYFLWDGDFNSRFAAGLVLTILPIILVMLPAGPAQTLWSPYYRIDLDPMQAPDDPSVRLGYNLSVNKAWHQVLLNLDPAFVAAHRSAASDHFADSLAHYDAPFLAASRLDRVLIVGAGTGNDVAAAERAGAGTITAVEIDPVILDIGQRLHPETPYAPENGVRQVTDDARAFFRTDGGRYDLILFGLLDSHTVFSSASSVRLDNFVYTVQSLREVRQLLAPDGMVALSFGVPHTSEWVARRLYRTLALVFGHPPQVYAFPGEFMIFFIGDQPFNGPVLSLDRAQPRPDLGGGPSIEPATDDWPYLYLRRRGVPATYLIALLGVLAISALLVRRALPRASGPHPHFFFLGAAFFLLETKSVTELALLIGSTWLVNAAVIAAILLVIILANLVVLRFNLRKVAPCYALLAAALLFNYFVPVGRLLGLGLLARVVLASLAQALPVFFAGLVFAISFRRTTSVESALGANLIGSVLGGALEYASLAWGIRSLYLLALGLYALSLWGLGRPKPTSVQPALLETE